MCQFTSLLTEHFDVSFITRGNIPVLKNIRSSCEYRFCAFFRKIIVLHANFLLSCLEIFEDENCHLGLVLRQSIWCFMLKKKVCFSHWRNVLLNRHFRNFAFFMYQPLHESYFLIQKFNWKLQNFRIINYNSIPTCGLNVMNWTK